MVFAPRELSEAQDQRAPSTGMLIGKEGTDLSNSGLELAGFWSKPLRTLRIHSPDLLGLSCIRICNTSDSCCLGLGDLGSNSLLAEGKTVGS